MDDIIFLNGDFISKSNAQISVMDRGFFFKELKAYLIAYRHIQSYVLYAAKRDGCKKIFLDGLR